MLTHAAWAGVPSLRHGFLDRAECTAATGGEAVASVGVPLPIAIPRQVHGTRVVTAEPHMEAPEADGLVTARTGFLVGVLTADCAPVLLVDRRRRVAAAVHAGWRGTAAGALQAPVGPPRAPLRAPPHHPPGVHG